MNKIVIIGNLTKDPDFFTGKDGNCICKFTVAVNRRDYTKGVDYLAVTAFKKRAEVCRNYLSKGRKVCIAGTLRQNTYTDNTGNNRVSTEIIAEDIEFLSNVTHDVGAEEIKATDFIPVDNEDMPF